VHHHKVAPLLGNALRLRARFSTESHAKAQNPTVVSAVSWLAFAAT
jgi:hypothetical protein